MIELDVTPAATPEFARTDTLTVEIPQGLLSLLRQQASDGKATLDSYVSMLLVKGSYKR